MPPGKALMVFATWLLIGIANLSASCSHAASVSTQGEHPDAVFYDLARRDIANDVLMNALAERADVMAISEKLQLHTTSGAR